MWTHSAGKAWRREVQVDLRVQVGERREVFAENTCAGRPEVCAREHLIAALAPHFPVHGDFSPIGFQ